MLCKCSNQFRIEGTGSPSSTPHELRLASVSREFSAKLREGELKLLQGSIHEAEVSLREALSINNEVHFWLHKLCYFPSFVSACSVIFLGLTVPEFVFC